MPSPVVLGATPTQRDAILVQLEAKLAAAPRTDLRGWWVTVEPYPARLPRPVVNPFDGKVVTVAVSYVDLVTRHLALSWRYLPDGTLDVEDVAYEMANIRCGCESGLR